MRNSSKSIITASLVLPLLLVACDRADQSPTATSGVGQEKPATNPAPPTDLSKNPAAPSSSSPSVPETPPVSPETEPKKEN